MKRQLLVVANGANARLFTRELNTDPLVPLDHLQADDRSASTEHHFGRRQRDGDAAGVPLSPHTDARLKEQSRFAHAVAQRIDQAIAAGQCQRLVIVASNPFLGALRKALSPVAQAAIGSSTNLDLTALALDQLEERLAQVFQQRTASA